jgi:hypothetical protein
VKSALLVSGIYDLLPVRLSARNEYVHLDEKLEHDYSPIRRWTGSAAGDGGMGRARGGRVRPQSREFSSALKLAGKLTEAWLEKGSTISRSSKRWPIRARRSGTQRLTCCNDGAERSSQQSAGDRRGGGIGGLAAALALARKGFRSVVLEQAPQFGEIGAGIQLAPNAWHALDALGVGGLVKKERSSSSAC